MNNDKTYFVEEGLLTGYYRKAVRGDGKVY